MTGPVLSPDRRRFYVIVAALLAVWAAVVAALTVTVVPDLYWYSYYAIDYSLGFVRRGLAGELVGLLPGDDIFVKQRVGRWVSSGAYLVALTVLVWWIAAKSGRSERRLQLALLAVVLPFGFAFGLLQAGSTLFGGAALIGFAVAVSAAGSRRAVLVACAMFGVANAVLALLHEAIPLLFGIGVVAVVAVLATQLGRRGRWVGYALAIGPGVATALVVAALGKHGIADDLCALIPHAQVNNPMAGKPTPAQLLSGFRYYDDYHDWACRNITPFYNRDFVAGIRYVGRLGPGGMIVNSVYGVFMFVITMLAIGWVSGVPFRRVWDQLRRQWLALALGCALVVPIFLTGVDWARWWVNLTLDIGVVYLLYASRQLEVDAPPTRRSTRAFLLVVIGLAVLPVGIIPAFMAPLPI